MHRIHFFLIYALIGTIFGVYIAKEANGDKLLDDVRGFVSDKFISYFIVIFCTVFWPFLIIIPFTKKKPND